MMLFVGISTSFQSRLHGPETLINDYDALRAFFLDKKLRYKHI